MKSIIIIFFTSIAIHASYSQVPQKMSYQAVVRDTLGMPFQNSTIGIKVSLLPGTMDTTSSYTETHTTESNANGLISFEVGTGNTSGSLDSIDWTISPWYIKTEFDPSGGVNYQFQITQQLLSVPYAQVAQTSLGIRHLTIDQLASGQPREGMLAYVKDNPQVVFYNGSEWVSLTTGLCFPQPTIAETGPDQIIDKDTTQTLISANMPESGIGKWIVTEGEGGSFADATNAETIFTGEHFGSYKIVWQISTLCDTSTAEMIVSFGDETVTSFTDERDGQEYDMVKIGTQTWMAENLNFYTDTGSVYPEGDSAQWANEFGRLYNWYTAQEVCPDGWHLPSRNDWDTLIYYYVDERGDTRYSAYNLMKEVYYWTAVNNESGFSAVPSGAYFNPGFGGTFEYAYYWIMDVDNITNEVYHIRLDDGEEPFHVVKADDRLNGYSVRCIKDDLNYSMAKTLKLPPLMKSKAETFKSSDDTK